MKDEWKFPREARLVRRSEYDAVYRAGKRRSSSHFTIFVRPNELPLSRFGFSIKKALGGAVVRNRITTPIARDGPLPPPGDTLRMGLRDASKEFGGQGIRCLCSPRNCCVLVKNL